MRRILALAAAAALAAPAAAQGPVVLLGIDAEDGFPTGHGGSAPYVPVMDDVLANVTNGGTGILVIGGGKSATDDVTGFWSAVGAATTPPQAVTFVNGAANIAGVSFNGFAVIAIASSVEETSSGGLTDDENNALTTRAPAIASFVNGGGGLFGLSQSELSDEYGYLGGIGAFATVSGLGYDDVEATPEGEAVGLDDTTLDLCCWHDEYLAFPDFLQVLATNVDTGNAAAVGGADVVIVATGSGGRRPGSVLVYPVHRSGPGQFTVVAVTNTNTLPAGPLTFGGTTNVEFDYVNVVTDRTGQPTSCFVTDRVEQLTPGDTLSVLTGCHNAADAEGYLVVVAQDPGLFKTAWSFDHLVGSEIVVTSLGGSYALNAIPFQSPLEEGAPTDVDGDGELDFDDLEYVGVPDELYMPSFVASGGSSLALINLTGGTEHTAAVHIDVWNDNEFPLSTTAFVRCWFDTPLDQISAVFDRSFLQVNTPHDPSELDVDCDGFDDFETGWARIRGLWASSDDESIQDPALLGALVAEAHAMVAGGELLWESKDRQTNGDFLHTSTNHPEY